MARPPPQQLAYARDPRLSAALATLATSVVDRYITRAWYASLSPSPLPAFRAALMDAAATATRTLDRRAADVDWHAVLWTDVLPLVRSLYRAWAVAAPGSPLTSASGLGGGGGGRGAPALVPNGDEMGLWPSASTPSILLSLPRDPLLHALVPHPALDLAVLPTLPPSGTPTALVDLPFLNHHLRATAAVVLDVCLPAHAKENDAERILVRELVAGILAVAVDAASDPRNVLHGIRALVALIPVPLFSPPSLIIWIATAVWAAIWTAARTTWTTLQTAALGLPPAAVVDPTLVNPPPGTDLDLNVLETLNAVLLFSSDPTTRPLSLVWQTCLRPVLALCMGRRLDRALASLADSFLTPDAAAFVVDWVTATFIDEPLDNSPFSPDPTISVDSLRTGTATLIADRLGLPFLKRVLDTHTLRLVQSRYALQHALLGIIDLVTMHLMVEVVTSSSSVQSMPNSTAVREQSVAASAISLATGARTGRRRQQQQRGRARERAGGGPDEEEVLLLSAAAPNPMGRSGSSTSSLLSTASSSGAVSVASASSLVAPTPFGGLHSLVPSYLTPPPPLPPPSLPLLPATPPPLPVIPSPQMQQRLPSGRRRASGRVATASGAAVSTTTAVAVVVSGVIGADIRTARSQSGGSPARQCTPAPSETSSTTTASGAAGTHMRSRSTGGANITAEAPLQLLPGPLAQVHRQESKHQRRRSLTSDLIRFLGGSPREDEQAPLLSSSTPPPLPSFPSWLSSSSTSPSSAKKVLHLN
ncbi:hypothetical protein BC828DRAFT_380116 [Blastocladiella britannica]|nr:hypothetical protein BC828DRAFT_380116 [Blastocladiella britannica]